MPKAQTQLPFERPAVPTSTSIVLNFAEGSSRSSKKDRKRFYEMAFGSFLECRAVLALTKNACATDAHLGASLYKLITALRI